MTSRRSSPEATLDWGPVGLRSSICTLCSKSWNSSLTSPSFSSFFLNFVAENLFRLFNLCSRPLLQLLQGGRQLGGGASLDLLSWEENAPMLVQQHQHAGAWLSFDQLIRFRFRTWPTQVHRLDCLLMCVPCGELQWQKGFGFRVSRFGVLGFWI